MATKSHPSAPHTATVIVPVRPAASPAQAPSTATRGLLRRTLGRGTYSPAHPRQEQLLAAHPRQEQLLAPHPRQEHLLTPHPRPDSRRRLRHPRQ